MATPSGNASISLVDTDNWKLSFGGFLALDAFQDSTQGVGEIIGNGPLPRPGTKAGDHGRLQLSAKHSRLHLTILAPSEDGWTNKGYIEGDFLAGGGGNPSEQDFFGNGTFRIRHAYFSLEKSGWKILVGQASLLFGFVPSYLLATVSVIPGPAQVYQRTPQVQVAKSLSVNPRSQIDMAIAMARPTQSVSETPNFDAGIKWSHRARTGKMALVSGEVKQEPLSLALSGTMRKFKTTDRATFQHVASTTGAALSLNALVPLITSGGASDTQSLLMTSSFTTGTGYSDILSGWTANLSRFPTDAADPIRLDAGEGGFDAEGNFRLIPIQTWNAQLQYHLPQRYGTWLTFGFGKLWTRDVDELGPVASNRVPYDGVSFYFFNVVHDFSKSVRLAGEYSRKSVHYLDDVAAKNDRYQVTAFFRF